MVLHLYDDDSDRTTIPYVNYALVALDQMLLVLMLIEILHTVRISIRTQRLTMVPFLIVGLIASIRRVLVITMNAATIAEESYKGTSEQAMRFRDSMIELGLSSILILVFVFSIVCLRESSRRSASRLSDQPSAVATGVSHIAIQEALDGKNVNWMEKVSDEQYGK